MVKQIITIPNPILREKAQKVEIVDKKLNLFIKDLEQTLQRKDNPKGVGLASPQVGKLLRVFCINLKKMETFINPEITKKSDNLTLGKDPEDPIMEGCLSMPHLYGPVPRFEWIEVKYQVVENEKLITKQGLFRDFHARVFQHELDHLDGILFTDHSLKFDLPVYKEIKKDKYEEVDRDLLKLY